MVWLMSFVMLCGCTLIQGPRRQRVKEVRDQQIPETLLNTYWDVVSVDGQQPDCGVSIGLLDKGQLTIVYKDEVYDGNYLWYVVRDADIYFHTRPLYKPAWTSDDCKMNPFVLSLYLESSGAFKIQPDGTINGQSELGRLVLKKRS